MKLKKLAPAVSRHWLLLLAGSMWTAVGLMLLWRALGWLTAMELPVEIALGLFGLLLGFLAYRFGFIHTARRNISRLCRLPDRVCLFAFNSWKGYLIIALMVTLGITLRRSPIPRPYLALLYSTMGSALFWASLHFYDRFWRVLFLKQPCWQEQEGTDSSAT